MTVDDKPDRYQLGGDVPKRTLDEDEFGLDNIVSALADTLLTRVSVDGYILGIQGPWGSGKSSIVNFVAEKIIAQETRHQLIRFDPWLIGEKRALLSFFLGQLSKRVDELERSGMKWRRVDYWFSRWTKKTLAEKVRKYGEYAAALSTPVGSLAATDPSGGAALTAVGLKGVGYLKKLFDASAQSLDRLKSNIASDLIKLKKKIPSLRFTVIIDDTDRLEPAEAIEVLRLIRKVADFPLVTYVLCFDERVLARQVKVALSVADGHEYIEKIFQNVIAIPPQEPFALRRYLRQLLTSTFATEMRFIASESNKSGFREHVVLDLWCGRLMSTPRDVVRLYEAVKLGWVHVPVGSDFLDFIWLQLIKLKSRSLYVWTQDYLTNIAAYRDGGRPGDTEPKELGEKLFKIMGDLHWAEQGYHSGLGTLLPGVGSFVLDGDKRKVFEFQHDELKLFESERRLGSPTHWRQYFAFDLPTYALSDDYIASFRRSAANDFEEGASMLRELLARPHIRRGHFVDVLLDRLLDAGKESFSPDEMYGFLLTFGEVMDEIAADTKEIEKSGRSEIWRKATRILNSDAAEEFIEVVRRAKSINWLAEVVRDQGFAHGLPDGDRKEPDRQWLGSEQLQRAIMVLINRFKNTEPRELFEKPSPLDILFCWFQLGEPQDVRAYVANAMDTDEGFLVALNGMRSWASSSNIGVHHPLHKDCVQHFTDADQAKARLERLASMTTTPTLQARVKELLSEWEERR